MTYETARGRPTDGQQYEAKVPATIDTKSMLEKLAAAFKRLRKTDGQHDR